jgi:hypothetical protein
MQCIEEWFIHTRPKWFYLREYISILICRDFPTNMIVFVSFHQPITISLLGWSPIYLFYLLICMCHVCFYLEFNRKNKPLTWSYTRYLNRPSSFSTNYWNIPLFAHQDHNIMGTHTCTFKPPPYVVEISLVPLTLVLESFVDFLGSRSEWRGTYFP